MINTSDINKAKQQLNVEKKPKILEAQNESFNRKAIEKLEFDIILGIEKNTRKTNIKHVDSGLNHYLCKLMNKKKISLGVDLNNLKSGSKKEKAIKLEKIMENVNLCKKHKVNLVLFNTEDSTNAKAFLSSLGASTQQTSKALSF